MTDGKSAHKHAVACSQFRDGAVELVRCPDVFAIKSNAKWKRTYWKRPLQRAVACPQAADRVVVEVCHPHISAVKDRKGSFAASRETAKQRAITGSKLG